MFNILALLVSLIITPAQAQTCPTRPSGDNSNACASTAFVQRAATIPFSTSISDTSSTTVLSPWWINQWSASLSSLNTARFATKAAMQAASMAAAITYTEVDEVVTGSGCPLTYKINNSATGLYGEATVTVGGATKYATPQYNIYDLPLCQIGLVGDNVADDGATLNTALLALYGAHHVTFNDKNIELSLLAGRTYKIGTTVLMRQTNLHLNGNGATLNVTASVGLDWQQQAISGWPLNGAVKNLKMTGTSSTLSTQTAIRNIAAPFLHIQNVDISGFGIGLNICTVRPLIDGNNYIHANADRGIVLSSCYGAPYTLVANSTVGSTVNVTDKVAAIVGALVTGTNIPANTTISSITTIPGSPVTYDLVFSNAPTGTVGTFSAQNYGEAQAAILQGTNKLYNNRNGGLHIIDGVGHQIYGPDIEGSVGAIPLVRIQNGVGNMFYGLYAEPSAGASSVVQIDNTASIVPGRTATSNFFYGGVFGGGATWDFDIRAGNETLIDGIRYGAATINIGPSIAYTRINPGFGEPTVTIDPSSVATTRNCSKYKTVGCTGALPFSSTSVPLKNYYGQVTFTGSTQDAFITLPVTENDADYKVDLSQSPGAGAAIGTIYWDTPGTTQFAVHTTVAPGATKSVTLYWHLYR